MEILSLNLFKVMVIMVSLLFKIRNFCVTVNIKLLFSANNIEYFFLYYSHFLYETLNWKISDLCCLQMIL